MSTFKLLSGKHHAHGKVYLPGDLVELTEQEAKAFADKFEKVAPPPGETPKEGEKPKGK